METLELQAGQCLGITIHKHHTHISVERPVTLDKINLGGELKASRNLGATS
jgi:hypothetical protein